MLIIKDLFKDLYNIVLYDSQALKNLSGSDFLPTLLNYMLLKSFFRKKFHQNIRFLIILHLIIMFILLRMYFYNSIFILNGATTYFIWHALFKFSYIPMFTQRYKNISLPTYPETEE